jgi:hypothetical protein
MTRTGALALLAVACSSPEPAAQTAPSSHHASVDAAVVEVRPDTPVVQRKQRPLKQSRPVDIMLRSSPNGALAAVDGVPIGVTPVTWFGETFGVDVEFTFRKQGYATATYRFVPVQSGVVHARLDAALDPNTDPPPSLRRPPEPIPPVLQEDPPPAPLLVPETDPPGRQRPGPQP